MVTIGTVRQFLRSHFDDTEAGYAAVTEWVNSLVAAERERCAKIAENYHACDVVYIPEEGEIAREIRSGAPLIPPGVEPYQFLGLTPPAGCVPLGIDRDGTVTPAAELGYDPPADRPHVVGGGS